MGYYSGCISLEFDGTDCEKQMMEKLLQMMEPEAEVEWTLPLDEQFDFFPLTALLGPLKMENDYMSYRVIDYTLAPKLFAALFPASRFRYSIILEYSASMVDTPYLTVVYEDNNLMMRDSYLYDYQNEEKIGGLGCCAKRLKANAFNMDI